MRDHDLELKGVSKTAPGLAALAPTDVVVEAGEHVALLEHGDGAAATLMRIAAGFLAPDIGRVVFRGRDLTDRPPAERPTRWVATGLGLFAASIAEDVAWGLPATVGGRTERREAALAMLARHGLAEWADRPAADLGEAAAVVVALLRAVAGRPSLLLLDRPFLGVPVGERGELRDLLDRLRRETGVAILERCDAPDEAVAHADRIALFHRHRLIRTDTPDRLRSAPISVATARLIGEVCVLPGRLVAIEGTGGRVETALGVWSGAMPEALALGTPVAVAFRPECLELVDLDRSPGGSLNRFEADFVDRRPEGATVRLRFAAAGLVLTARRLDRGLHRPSLGARAALGVAVEDTWILPVEEGDGHDGA